MCQLGVSRGWFRAYPRLDPSLMYTTYKIVASTAAAVDAGTRLRADARDPQRLRENASSRSCGVSVAIAETQSAVKVSAVSACPTGTTAWVMVSS